MNIIENIESYARKFPNKIAYKINDEKLTYQELETQSSILANYIEDEAKDDKSPILVLKR